jgi:hypothetical protein
LWLQALMQSPVTVVINVIADIAPLAVHIAIIAV